MKKRQRTSAAPDGSPRRQRRRLVERVLIFAGCVLLVDGLVGEKGLVAMRRASEEQSALERSLDAAMAETRRLREEARRLRDDPAAIEELARRELGLIKPGEKVFTIRDVPPSGGGRR